MTIDQWQGLYGFCVGAILGRTLQEFCGFDLGIALWHGIKFLFRRFA